MVDLTLMYRLLDALLPQTRLILLGDPEQLPSVEAGNVLADLCRNTAGYSAEFAIQVKALLGVDIPVRSKPRQLVDAMCHFDKSYRFASESGIGQLASSIRAGEPNLVSSEDDEVQVFSLDTLAGNNLGKEITSYYFEYEMLIQNSEIDAKTLLANFEQTRILCAVRDGELGIESLNTEIERYLEVKNLKQIEQDFYHGRPIIITRNDYSLGLFNGDIGICIIDPRDRQIKTAFLDSAGEPQLYLTSRLPPHETCFAMTVHKSQGSEFDHVTLILPRPTSDATEQLLTRELVYTAITRARHSIAIYTDQDTWTATLARTVERMSGLSSFLTITGMNDEQLNLF
jgi:exodeoxyribonuclease V alpha subunit